jgi:hypothetical protein
MVLLQQGSFVSRLSVEQVHLRHRDRVFHFVSYQGQPEDRKRNRPAIDPAWFLMTAGKRWEVMPHQPDQEQAERDSLFTAWLEQHVFVPSI